MNWTVRSYDPNSGESFYTHDHGDDATAALREYADAEFHVRKNGGGIELKCSGRIISAYAGSAENE